MRRQYLRHKGREYEQKALFSDGTADYVRPFEPIKGDRVSIRFRTAKDDADKVTILSVLCGFL